MKRIVFLLALALVWGCQDRPIGPVEQVLDEGGASYGSSAITIPGMGGLAKAAQGVEFKFVLTITGRDMDPMTFAFPLGERDTMVMIENIPAGPSRLFTGVLYAPEGPTHEGSAVAEIMPGKVAYVKLFLRKTGSARVDVIIEGINDEQPNTTGCFEIFGEIEEVALDGFIIKVLEKNDSQLWAYVLRGEELVGKFWGTFDGMMFSGTIAMPVINMDAAMFKGGFMEDFSAFKGELYSMVDTTMRTGIMHGKIVPCDPVEPPPSSSCVVDTMGDPTSCKDVATWVRYATDECKRSGLSLGAYTFMEPCGDGNEKNFSYICYECCK